MKLLSQFRSGLLVTSACAVLAACSGSGDNSNQGDTGPVTINQGGGTGGNNTVTLIPAGFNCPSGTAAGTATVGTTDIQACVVPTGTFTADTTLPGTSGGVSVGYALQGSVFIGDNLISNPSGTTATLTIEPGAIIIGQAGEDALFVSPGSRLIADGDVNNPIVFTSAQDMADGSADDGQNSAGVDARGQFGGLVINGLAPINDCDVTTVDPVANPELCNKTGEGGSGLFGGDNPNDNSGILNFVRVQFAGFEFNGEDQLNGIAFQGVGDTTQASFLQVHNNQDDGIEWFGGTVDADHIVITGAGDDSLDWTDGWTGSLQYALVVQSDVVGDRGIEGDNRGNDVDILPRSNPNISNFTFFGGASGSDGLKLRAGTDGNIANGIVIGFSDGVDFDADSTVVTPTVSSIYNGGNAGCKDITCANEINAAGDTMDGVISGAAEQAVQVTDPTTIAAELEQALYVGAFDPATESNASNWTTGWTLDQTFPAANDAGCPSGTAQSSTSVPAGRSESRICIVPNSIFTDLTLTNGNLYSFTGSVFIGTDAGPDVDNPVAGAAQATLTIEPGVTVYGTAGEDAIIVSRGSQIASLGTQTAPVTMTSAQDVFGDPVARGQWGGLVINGRAPINDCDVTTVDPVANPEQCEKTGEGGSGLFGGNKPDDNSGTLNFTVVKNAGFEFNGEDQLNGIAFQGVGDATQVDFIQVENNQDDGVEFFGGTVDAKHIVLTNNRDDSLDWTDGWTGNVQYIIVQHSNSSDNGFEGDNRGNDTDILPRSTPLIANVTVLGASDSRGRSARLRAGTAGIIYNFIGTSFPGDSIRFDQDSALGEIPTFRCSHVFGNGGGLDLDDADVYPTDLTMGNNRDGDALGDVSTLTAAPDANIPVVPGTNEMQVTPCVPNTTLDSDGFFDDVPYIGAVADADDDWYKGWTFGLSN